MALVLRPGDQQIMFKELGQERDRMAQFGAVATPELAERVGALHKQFPSASGGVLLSSARSGMPDVNVAAIVRAADGVAPPKKKSLWQKAVSVLHTTASQPWRYLESQAPGVAEGIKDVSRVTFAGLEFSLQAVQNVGSNRGVRFESDADLRNIPDSLPFSENILDEGFMVSTDLGATLTGRDTGSGFFFGGEAKQFQEEMVRAYRGTTPGGEARSGGRSSAGMVFTEGSVPYNLASGFIDGVLALGIPATGIKTTATAVKGLAAADDAGAIVKGADRVLDVVRGKGTKIELSKISGAEYENARLAAGVLGDTIDPKLVNDFIGTRGGIRLMERLVDANTASAVRREIGQNVYPETIQLLRDAKDFNTVRKIVIDILGLPVAGISRTNIRGTNLRPSNLRSMAVIDNLVGSFEASRLGILTDRAATATGRAVTDSRTGLLTERAFEKRASRAVVDFSSENPVDIRRSLNDMDRWMAKSLVDPADRVRFMDQALDAMTGPNATPTAQRKLKDDFQELVKASWVKKGPKSINEDVANAVMTAHLQSEQAARTFNNSLTGALDDGGAYMALDGKNANVADGVLGGPQWQGELGKFMVEMPDAGQVRALTGRWNRMWRKGPGGAFTDPNIQRMSQAGKLRLPFAGIRFVQEMVWRRGILATGGYAIRNLMEGQMSLALSQKPVTSLFRHPWEHLQVAAYRKMSGDILGEDFSAAAHIAGMKDYQHAVGVSISSQYVNPADVYRRGSRAGEFNRVKRGEDDIARVVEAHGDLIGKMNDDPVGRLLAAGADDTEILEFIRNTPEGQKWFRWQQDYSMNGRPLFDQTANKWADPQVIDLRNGHNMRLRLQELRHNRDLVIGGHPALAKAVETGLLPPVTVDVRKLGWDESFRGTRQQIPIGDGKDFYWARVDADDESIVRPFAFADGESSKQLTELLERPDILTDRTLAQTMVHETRRRGVDAEGLGAASTHMMDRFFGFIMGKPTAWLERSPAFKQRYYSWAIDEMVTSLSPVGLDEMITTITRKATELGVSPSQYVGDSGDLAETVLRLFGKPTADNIGPRWARLLDLQAKNAGADFIDPSFIKSRSVSPNASVMDTLVNNRIPRMEKTLSDLTEDVAKLKSMSPSESFPLADLTDSIRRGEESIKNVTAQLSHARKWATEAEGSGFFTAVDNARDTYGQDISNSFTRHGTPSNPGAVHVLRVPKENVISQASEFQVNRAVRPLKSFGPVTNAESAATQKLAAQGYMDSLKASGGLGDDVILAHGGPMNLKGAPALADADRLYGTLNLADIDMYAKGAALDDLSKMLYDASERNNLIDVARWIAPFGQAQLEFYRRLSRIYTVQTGGIPLPNLEALRKTQFMIENGREADPDSNGRGFFYKDEQTGDMMFDYPMSSVETKWLTGLSSGPGVAATATAPLKGAILGFDFKVGIGPVAQIAASLLLQDKPEYDFMRRALLPYGETDLSRGAIEGTVSGFIPAWTEKLLSAFFDSEESSTAYGNAFMEVFQALGASGEYDMADPNERDRARQDAKPKARALTVIRAVGQWFGPSRPTLRLGVDIKEGNIKEGNVLLNVVSQHFRELELEDPDTAVARFEDLYGADMMVALMRKTKSNVGGLQASVKFGDFERDNPALFRKYKSVAGYFVEGGTDWDWIVYGRQLKQVKRERLTTEESWLAAETLVGWSKWRVAQDLFNLNPNPTKEGREAMKEYRGTLDLRYPGFADMTIKPNKINNLAIDLRNAVKEPGMVNNPVALAATRYLNARDGMLYLAEKQYGLKTLRESTKTAALRAALRAEAQLIIETYPDFARLYQQLFEREIEE